MAGVTYTTPPAFTTRPDLRGTFGATASTHWLATASAQSVLERGGNAFDAAVAGGFVLHVVEPHLNGPGGDLTAVYATADAPDEPTVLVGQGPAPAGATREHYLAEGLELVPGSGALAAAVPGAVDAWLHLLAEHGTWELADVLAPAVGYARDGHPVVARVGETVAAVADLFREHWPTSADRWMPHGRPPLPGEMVTNEPYARVLDGLVAAGAGVATRAGRISAARHEWATGLVAQAVERAARVPHRHSSGTDHAGVIRASDLAAFRATTEPAATVRFRGHVVAKTGPWGQGPALLQALALLDPLPDEMLDPSTELGAHTVVEVQKLAYADREAWAGDAGPDATSGAGGAAAAAALLADLLDPSYLEGRRSLVGERASHDLRPGDLPGRVRPAMPPLRTSYAPPALVGGDAGGTPPAAAAGTGEPTVVVPTEDAGDEAAGTGDEPVETVGGTTTVGVGTAGTPRPAVDGDPHPDPDGVTRGDTCHLDVVDRWGNVVSVTPSGGWLQSSPTIPELGFCLGTRLQMTWLEEGTASTLTPGRRPRTTLTPTLVLRDGQPVAALGSPGGDQQDQWQLTYLLRTLVCGWSPQQAIDAPALHTTSFPGSFWPRTWTRGGVVVEDRLGDDVIAGLEARGHVVTRAGDWSLGRLSVVTRDPATGVVGAAANPRGGQAYAAAR